MNKYLEKIAEDLEHPFVKFLNTNNKTKMKIDDKFTDHFKGWEAELPVFDTEEYYGEFLPDNVAKKALTPRHIINHFEKK